ncbi:cadherin-23-like [Littorina saxatilis]|uniref:cadherin-23-like n=1 Tax=Littorina saxatilis TaxID=31220 RepID=UPI0038B4493B
MIDAITGNLTLNGSLDYESKTFYHFIVIASDQGTPSLNSTTDLFVTVKDVQDSPPVFTNLPYVKSVNENTAQGHAVLTVKAVDQDQAIPNQVGYNITHTDCPGLFALGANSGIISVGSTLDRDNSTLKNNAGRCAITVQATEQSGPYAQKGNFIATETVTITVNDVNDNAPTFSGSSFSANITENSPAGTPLQLDSGQQIVATDIDQVVGQLMRSWPGSEGSAPWTTAQCCGRRGSLAPGDHSSDPPPGDHDGPRAENQWGNPASSLPCCTALLLTAQWSSQSHRCSLATGLNSEIHLSLLGANDTFELVTSSLQGSGTVQLRVKNSARLDFEVRQSLNVQITAFDKELSHATAIATVTVNIENVNEDSPEFRNTEYTAAVLEGSASGTPLATVQATDTDAGRYGNVIYTLRNDRGLFQIDSHTGAVTVASNQTDREREDRYYMMVVATDGGDLQQTVPLTVNITDRNDNPPVFQRDQYDAVLREGDTVFSRPVKVEANDADEPNTPNSNVTFSINQTSPSGLQNHFRLDPISGQLTVTHALDFERIQFSSGPIGVVNLVVVASDRGTPSKQATAAVDVTLVDINDKSPMFKNLPYSAQVHEGSREGSFVLNVSATDADGTAPNNVITYSIESGGQDRFRINSDNGTITVSGAIDREQVSNYVLVVVARDRAASSRSNSSSVTIAITDVNDELPTFGSKADVRIERNESFHGVLYDMTATDPDEDSALIYQILYDESSGQSGTFQSLDAQTIQSWESSSRLGHRNRKPIMEKPIGPKVEATVGGVGLPK